MGFISMADMEKAAAAAGIPLWKAIMEEDMKERSVSMQETMDKMRERYHAMKQADEDYEQNLKSFSGLSGGDGANMHRFVREGEAVSGGFMGMVVTRALKMGESNACMKRIVAAPTAGACGVVPAVFLTYEQFYRIPERTMIEGLFMAAGAGQVIARRASISGAQGGCQAEIGAAVAMGAAMVSYLRGQTMRQIEYAAEIGIEHHLGLTCDPVGGYVMIPCIERNAVGVLRAMDAAVLAEGISDLREHKVSFDMVVNTMNYTGRKIPIELRETSLGGLARVVPLK